MTIAPQTSLLADIDSWTQQLEAIAAEPLEFCPAFPAIAQRFEAWWAHDCFDRPVFIGTSNLNPARPINRRLDLLDDSDAWYAAKFLDLQQSHRVGDALPLVRVDFGPVLLGGLLGGEMEFGADTAWTHPMIRDDWSNEPDWRLSESNPLWQRLVALMDRVARAAHGRFVVQTPDLGGAADVLLNLRGSTGLCLDVFEHPDRIRDAIDAIYPAWDRAWAELYRLALGRQAGLIHWLHLWSNRPYVVPACDFNSMIGTREFGDLCLADIARQAGAVGRAVFHLDGPQAARHIDALLAVDELQAIQFTPGEGTPSAVAWAPMFRKIQACGKSVLVFCPANEVLNLCDELPPEGLAISITDPLAARDLTELFRRFERRFT